MNDTDINQRLSDDGIASLAQKPELVRVNMGCGFKKLDGWINVDDCAEAAPDVVHNIESFPWPFDDASIDVVGFYHSLEHVGADARVFFRVFEETYRVLKMGGTMHVVVPHPRNDVFFGDPTHVRVVTPEILRHFSKKTNSEWIANGWATSPLSRGMCAAVDLEMVGQAKMRLMPDWQAKLDNGAMTIAQIHQAAQTYFNVVHEIEMTLRKAS